MGNEFTLEVDEKALEMLFSISFNGHVTNLSPQQSLEP